MADHGVGANLGGPDPAPHRLQAVLTLSGASAETARAVVAADNHGLVVKTLLPDEQFYHIGIGLPGLTPTCLLYINPQTGDIDHAAIIPAPGQPAQAVTGAEQVIGALEDLLGEWRSREGANAHIPGTAADAPRPRTAAQGTGLRREVRRETSAELDQPAERSAAGLADQAIRGDATPAAQGAPSRYTILFGDLGGDTAVPDLDIEASGADPPAEQVLQFAACRLPGRDVSVTVEDMSRGRVFAGMQVAGHFTITPAEQPDNACDVPGRNDSTTQSTVTDEYDPASYDEISRGLRRETSETAELVIGTRGHPPRLSSDFPDHLEGVPAHGAEHSGQVAALGLADGPLQKPAAKSGQHMPVGSQPPGQDPRKTRGR
jgi:hypothetical protein